MRTPRAIIFDEAADAQAAWGRFFKSRGYEAAVFRDASACPVYEHADGECCPGPRLCGDLMIVVESARNAQSIETLISRRRSGCKLPLQNRAVISPLLPDYLRESIEELGAALLPTPLAQRELDDWIRGCESRMDLAQSLAVKRRAPRRDCRIPIRYRDNAGSEERSCTAVNLSAGGMCLRTEALLRTGQTLHLAAEDPSIPLQAVVQWVTPSGDGVFLSGLAFKR